MGKERLNILVTGANGQLGRSIRCAALNSSDNYFFTDLPELDITDSMAVEKYIFNNDINVIINCAAYTNVEAAEDHKLQADKLNGVAPGILASAIKKRNGHLIHISTDYVFGGKSFNKPINELQPTGPTGVYGHTKLQGEKAIEDSGVPAIIIRTAWLYSDYGNNFVDKIQSLLQTRENIKVVFDQCGTPTYAKDLAEAIIDIISERKLIGNEGIYHFSNEGVCSWFDFAEAIRQLSRMGNKKIYPCHSSEFQSNVVRPSYSVLDKTKFKETFSREIPYWRISLEKCIQTLNNK